ncbi:MAG: Asp-tRNA(Asn)/Glu-tRNA(Gln) amidotransferase subunit GatC [Betaproteobacteria bacterium]|jgi:aspartyl-tRNA(Asn)/glutamyl-tRNA(Gln) amidotransferase subunit C|nr:Asp-tRNA(Asn)/Glu-tRNA(Gln) amidotransferase subunit GatC [Betaproteobacteria bacterium]
MLTRDDVQRLAELARLAIDSEEADQTLPRLNAVFGLIEQLQAAAVNDAEPLVHPGANPKFGTRLRADSVTEQVDRTANQISAPKVADGLYLVPRVVE